MTDKKDVKAQSLDKLEVLVGQGDMDAKRELAIRLIEGNGVPQNHPKAVALLEDCVTLGDAESMLMLAKCCALGRGVEHDAERAESLISEAANKGNRETQCLMKLIDDWKGQKSVDLEGLALIEIRYQECSFFMFNTGKIKDELTIERVCLLMNIVPCRKMNFECKKSQCTVKTQSKTNTVSLVCAEWNQKSTTWEMREQHH